MEVRPLGGKSQRWRARGVVASLRLKYHKRLPEYVRYVLRRTRIVERKEVTYADVTTDCRKVVRETSKEEMVLVGETPVAQAEKWLRGDGLSVTALIRVLAARMCI